MAKIVENISDKRITNLSIGLIISKLQEDNLLYRNKNKGGNSNNENRAAIKFVRILKINNKRNQVDKKNVSLLSFLTRELKPDPTIDRIVQLEATKRMDKKLFSKKEYSLKVSFIIKGKTPLARDGKKQKRSFLFCKRRGLRNKITIDVPLRKAKEANILIPILFKKTLPRVVQKAKKNASSS